uniref:Phosphatidic acid phosphatase type 2/haloperoxidase domain-containing protein n=1 Tax=Haptolina brevifila TaxID=156173 RepID=A0A7S2JMV9_9EUKA
MYQWPLTLALGCGALVGITRNFLAMHWPSDTLAALVIGGGLGIIWGRFDPWTRLLSAGSPLLSLTAATAFTLGLLCLLVAVRQIVPPVASDVRNAWYANAVASLPPEEQQAVLDNPRRQLKPRNLKSKLPMLTTIWCTLAVTGLYPYTLPSAALEPTGRLSARLLHTLIGLIGLGGVASLKQSVGGSLERIGIASDRVKGALKGLTYVALCAWTFLLSQLASSALLRLL